MESRRRHPHAAVTFAGNVAGAACTVEGLSERGARLKGVDAAPGDRVVVDVHTAGGVVRATADVLRRDEDGVGVAFAALDDAARRIVRAAVDAAPSPHGTVLVVDASATWRGALAHDIGALGYPIETASSALEALSRIEEPDRDVDCVLIERGLPDIDGPDLASFIAAHYPNVRRVLVVADRGDADDDADTAPDCHAVLPKPWTRLGLVCALVAP